MTRVRGNCLRAALTAVVAPACIGLAVLTPSSSVEGCGAWPFPFPALPPAVVNFISPTEAWICFENYETFGAQPGQICVCAVRNVGPIAWVEEAKIVNATTDEQISGWDFTSNPDTGAGFSMQGGGGFWSGFSSLSLLPIPGGEPINIKFRVHLAVLCPDVPCAADVNGDGVVDVNDATETAINAGPCPPCPWDFNGDGVVDELDQDIVTKNFGPCMGACPWDLNGDDTVDMQDLLEVVLNAGPCPTCPWDVDCNGFVDPVIDVNLVLANFGPCMPPSQPAAGKGNLGEQLLQAMQDAPNLIGTDEGDFSGMPTGDHLSILAVDSVSSTCFGDTDMDGDVDVDDLQNVISDWSPGAQTHGGDVTDNTGTGPPDGTTDVNDLNVIISNWGDCTE